MDILNELRSVTHKTVIHLTHAEPLSVPRRSKKKDRLAALSTVRRRDHRQHARERRPLASQLVRLERIKKAPPTKAGQ
jgi:hypothetical protein